MSMAPTTTAAFSPIPRPPAAATSSIYVVSIREDGLCGIQTSAPEFEAVDTDRGIFKRDLFEWDCGITIEDFYSALRLSSITNAAITA